MKLDEAQNSGLENLNQEQAEESNSPEKEKVTNSPNTAMEWFVLRVQSGREDKVKASLESRNASITMMWGVWWSDTEEIVTLQA